MTFPVTAADAHGWAASEASGEARCSCRTATCTSVVNQPGEGTHRTSAGPVLSATLEQPLLPTPVAAAALLSLVITNNPSLQREPPTTKISADKVIQLSTKGDFKKVRPNAGKTLSNKHAQLWVWNTTEQLCHSCGRKQSISPGYQPPSTISLLVHCPPNWKLGPFSLSVPFPGGFHPDGAVSCLPRHAELPRRGACKAAGSRSCRAASPQPTASTGRAGAKGVFAWSRLMANTGRPVRALLHCYHGLGATKEGRKEK